MRPLGICTVNFSLLFVLLLLMGCPRDRQYQYTTIPKIEECRFLARSVFCIDRRLSDRKIDGIIQYIQSQGSLTPVQKTDLIEYFNRNREEIIKEKEFSIPFNYLGFFRGYFLTNPQDELELKNYIDSKLLKLDQYINRFGEI